MDGRLFPPLNLKAKGYKRFFTARRPKTRSATHLRQVILAALGRGEERGTCRGEAHGTQIMKHPITGTRAITEMRAAGILIGLLASCRYGSGIEMHNHTYAGEK